MRRPAVHDGQEGFTLIELLVVLVILPLIIGAAASAFLVSVRTDVITSGKLADSENAQLGSAYFGRDVQVATEVTTDSAAALGGTPLIAFNDLSPQICGPTTVLSNSVLPANETLLIALYRPAQAPSTALDVAYWLEGSGGSTQINRYSCTLSSLFRASSPVVTVVADNATNPNSPTQHITEDPITTSVVIAPDQIAQAAGAGWTFTNPVSAFSGSTSLTLGAGPFSLPVPTTWGFASGDLTLQSSRGLETIDCTTVSNPSLPGPYAFSGCTGGTGTVSIGDAIHQASVTAVQVTVSEPTSSYRYVLQGLPAGDSSGKSQCLGTHCPTPSLLVLGGGMSLNGTGSVTCDPTGTTTKVCVTGDVVLDGGSADCAGGAAIGATGSVGTVSPPSDSNCDPGQISPSPFVSDPVAGSLPYPCFSTVPSLTSKSATPGTNLTPGIYTAAVSNVTLEPGVYVFEGGITGSVSLASPSTTDQYFYNPPTSTTTTYDPSAGVLMYLPGNGYPSGCINVASPSGISLSPPSGDVAVSPLDSNQSRYWFGSPYLADMWVWQDVTNTQPFTLSGNVTVTSAGLAYLPGAALVTSSGSPSITTGRMIVGGVSLSGTPVITLTGS